MLKFVRPTAAYEAQVMAYRRAFLHGGEEMDGCAGLERCETYDEWLAFDTRLKALYGDGYVPSTVFLAVREADDTLVGILDCRHFLSEFLLNYGGHIGYSVHPAQRSKGYAKEMLRFAVEHFYKPRGVAWVLVICDRDNEASRRTILANGGRLENEVPDGADGWIQRYWIACAERTGQENEKRIETERLILRPLREDDAADAFEWLGDPVVNRYMPYPLYKDVAQARKWIASIAEEENEFGFVLKETGKMIGSGSVTWDPSKNAYDLGYNLARAYWGQGYATEAARAMLCWARTALNARDFTSAHVTANVASGKVLQKCGFRFERFGHYGRFDGSEMFDASFYTLHVSDQ